MSAANGGRPPERPLANHLRLPLSIAMQRLGTACLAADCWLRDDPIWVELRREADAELEHYLSGIASSVWRRAA